MNFAPKFCRSLVSRCIIAACLSFLPVLLCTSQFHARIQKIRKEQVLTDDAGYEDISIRDERTTTLASAFEPAAVIEALAEIAASPQVWKIDGDKYEEVDILTREQTIGRHGSLGCIEISLRPRQETRCL